MKSCCRITSNPNAAWPALLLLPLQRERSLTQVTHLGWAWPARGRGHGEASEGIQQRALLVCVCQFWGSSLQLQPCWGWHRAPGTLARAGLCPCVTPLGCSAGQGNPASLSRCQLCVQLPALWEAELLASLYAKCDPSTPCQAAEQPALGPAVPPSAQEGPTLSPGLFPSVSLCQGCALSASPVPHWSGALNASRAAPVGAPLQLWHSQGAGIVPCHLPGV